MVFFWKSGGPGPKQTSFWTFFDSVVYLEVYVAFLSLATFSPLFSRQERGEGFFSM